jgi:hypothetical protein
MDRPTGGDQKGSFNSSSGQTRRKRRRRTLLNLGAPFVQIDDFLNQSEDAVVLGYRVLEQTVEEIRNGYKDARDFNEKREKYEADQEAYERGDKVGPAPLPPAIPWTQLVTRAQNLQEFAIQAVTDSTKILFDSIRSGTESIKSVAKTWEQSRDDVEAKPVLAGPIFEETIVITASAGDRPDPEVRTIRHRGLARLRIHAEVNPPLKDLRPSGTEKDSAISGGLHVTTVKFGPRTERDDEEFSVLVVDVGPIRSSQKPAVYEGLITAKNFQLLIAKLRVEVVARKAPATRPTKAKRQAPPTMRSPATTRTRATTKTDRAGATKRTK